MQRIWLLAAAVALIGSLVFLCRRAAQAAEVQMDGYVWGQAILDLGEIPLGRTATATVSWSVTGDHPIDVLMVQPSCGCARADLTTEGELFTQGRLDRGATGLAKIELRERNSPGTRNNQVDVAWHVVGDTTTRVSKLAIDGVFIAAWQATPSAIVAMDRTCGDTIPIDITWRALRSDVRPGKPILASDVPLDVQALEYSRNGDGCFEVILRGTLRLASNFPALTHSTMRVDGFEPALPDVPIRIGLRQLITVSPARILELKASADGAAQATAEVRLDPELDGARLTQVTVEPESERERVAAAILDHSRGRFGIAVQGRFGPDVKHAFGSLRVLGDHPKVGELSIRWMYLKPRGHPEPAVQSEEKTK